jgi:rhodanese-related sulfurtransferase
MKNDSPPPQAEERTAAIAHFTNRLRFETDPDDVARALASGDTSFHLLDARSRDAYDAAHIPGAYNLSTPLGSQEVASLPAGPIVVYCWGPGCNGAVKRAHELAVLGRPAKEMLGGFEYWVREGHPIEGVDTKAISEAIDRCGVVRLRSASSCMC